MQRRRFLQLSAATLAAHGLLPGCDPNLPPGIPDAPPDVDVDGIDGGTALAFDPGAIAEDAALFALGVQAGSMRAAADGVASTVLLWTATDAPPAGRLVLRVWRDSDVEGQIVFVQDLEATPDAEGFVKVRVAQLAPSTWYRYGFFVDDGAGGFVARSALGRVRTAWASDWLWPVVIGATTCTQAQSAPFDALTTLANDSEVVCDAFVHLGDMVYADGSRTREDYRFHWRRALQDPGYRALLAQQGSYIVWDDHEFDNNINPEQASSAEKIENGKAEFFANLPMEANDTGGLWQSYQWGRTVEVFALDARTERRPSTRETGEGIYISVEQMAWLKARLAASPARYKVILNSVPMTRMPPLWGFQGDRWQGYEVQRNELLGFLEEEGIQGVWFLSGDFHMGFVAHVETEGYAKDVYEVAVGPGGNLGNPLALLANQEDLREDVFPSAQFLYGAGRLAATTLTFDPLREEVRVRYVGVDGTVLFDERIKS